MVQENPVEVSCIVFMVRCMWNKGGTGNQIMYDLKYM